MKAVIFDIGRLNHAESVLLGASKPQIEIFSRSCIEYIFDIIESADIKRALFVLGTESAQCKEIYPKEDYRWCFFEERDTTLSKALACDNSEDDIVLICKVAFYDIDIKSAIDFHHKENADITVVAARCDEATHNLQPDIFIISKRCRDMIANLDFARLSDRELDALQAENMKIAYYDCLGYRCNILDISDYLRCHMDILHEKTKTPLGCHKSLSGNFCSSSIADDITIEPPCYIGKNVTIGKGAVISSSVICDNATIGEGAHISSSILQKGAYIGSNSVCDGSVVCKGASVLTDARIFSGAFIGEKAIVGRGACVRENVVVFPGRKVSDFFDAAFDVRKNVVSLEFDDESCISGETGTEITPQAAVRIGRALGANNSCFVVGRNDSKAAIAISAALVSGALSCGADVWDVGECTGTELDFAIKISGAAAGVFLQADSYTKISAFRKFSQRLGREDEKYAESAMKHDCAPKIGAGDFGTLNEFSSVKSLYIKKLAAEKPDFPITINSSNKRVKEICNRLNIDSIGSKITFQISNDARKASAFSAQTGFVSYEKLAMICVENMLRQGEIPKIAHNFPKSTARIFEKYNALMEPCCDECESFFNDGFVLAFAVCKVLSSQKITLEQAKAALPKFAVAQRIVGITMPLSDAFERLKSFCRVHDDISVVPTKSGRTLVMRAECTEYETASELCDICQRMVQREE